MMQRDDHEDLMAEIDAFAPRALRRNGHCARWNRCSRQLMRSARRGVRPVFHGHATALGLTTISSRICSSRKLARQTFSIVNVSLTAPAVVNFRSAVP